MASLEEIRDEYLTLAAKTVNYDRFNQYAIVHHSEAIEGNTLTETETETLLEKGITPGGKKLGGNLYGYGSLQCASIRPSICKKQSASKRKNNKRNCWKSGFEYACNENESFRGVLSVQRRLSPRSSTRRENVVSKTGKST